MQGGLQRRNIVESDKSVLFTWRIEGTNPDFQRGTVFNWATHDSWFRKRMVESANLPFVAYEVEGNVVSYCRIDNDDGILMVSLIVSPLYRNQGMGQQSLRDFVDYCDGELGIHQMFALIHKLNAPSIRIFERIGFRYDIQLDSEFNRYVWISIP